MFKRPASVVYFSAHLPSSLLFFPQAYCRLNVLPSPTTDCKFLTKFTSLTPQTSLFICPNLQMCAIPPLPLCLLLSSCSLQLRDWLSCPPTDVAPGYLPPGGPTWIIPYNKHKSAFSSLITYMFQRCFYCNNVTVFIKGAAARRCSVEALMPLQG